MYTVKQVAELAGVSVRTLHYYDEIGLLVPTRVGDNGYRYYDDATLLRLQQILLYREIGLELTRIKDVLDQPDFDLVAALRSHRVALVEKRDRMAELLHTLDNTITHLTGDKPMSKKDKKKLFKGFSEEKQKQYEREARLQYGPTQVNESIRRWNGYTKAEQQAVMDEGNEVYLDLTKALKRGTPAYHSDVQAMLARWHQHIRYFYEPTPEIMRGLGDLYTTSPEFMAFFAKFHPDLVEYMKVGIEQYVDDLETVELERLMAAEG